jgi:hypothetical protein
MRAIDRIQFFWLIVLSITCSATALFVDETVYRFGNWKVLYRSSYFVFMPVSLLCVASAVACI